MAQRVVPVLAADSADDVAARVLAQEWLAGPRAAPTPVRLTSARTVPVYPYTLASCSPLA